MAISQSKATETRHVTVQPLSQAAFAPFGQVLSTEGNEPLPMDGLYQGTIECYKVGNFESDQPVEFLLSRNRMREFRLQFLERHVELTQTFFPLGGSPFVSVVAAPDAPLENGAPALSAIHAFIVPGDAAINIHRGTWHEPPFQLVDRSPIITTSHRSLTAGLVGGLDGSGEIHHLDVEKVDVTERLGYAVRLELP